MELKPNITLFRGGWISFLLTVFGMVGIPAIFLTFAWDASPWSAALGKILWRLAWPFFLPIVVTIASLRWHFGTISQIERVIAYLLSAGMVCVTLSGYVMVYSFPTMFKEWLGFFFPFLILIFGVFTLLRTRQNTTFKSYRSIMTMQTAYLANSLLCLSSFWENWKIGAYFSLVTTIAYLIQIGYVWRNYD